MGSEVAGSEVLPRARCARPLTPAVAHLSQPAGASRREPRQAEAGRRRRVLDDHQVVGFVFRILTGVRSADRISRRRAVHSAEPSDVHRRRLHRMSLPFRTLRILFLVGRRVLSVVDERVLGRLINIVPVDPTRISSPRCARARPDCVEKVLMLFPRASARSTAGEAVPQRRRDSVGTPRRTNDSCRDRRREPGHGAGHSTGRAFAVAREADHGAFGAPLSARRGDYAGAGALSALSGPAGSHPDDGQREPA